MAEQVLWLQGELQRLEQDIKDRENELKAATTEEGRAIVREWTDRLVQEKREVREQALQALSGLLLSAAKCIMVDLKSVSMSWRVMRFHVCLRRPQTYCHTASLL